MKKKTKQEWQEIAEDMISVKDAVNQINKSVASQEFKEGLLGFFKEKKILERETCSSFVLGVAFAEYSNKNVDSDSNEDMRNFYVILEALSNTNKVQNFKVGDQK
jgi:hypothetical protein